MGWRAGFLVAAAIGSAVACSEPDCPEGMACETYKPTPACTFEIGPIPTPPTVEYSVTLDEPCAYAQPCGFTAPHDCGSGRITEPDMWHCFCSSEATWSCVPDFPALCAEGTDGG